MPDEYEGALRARMDYFTHVCFAASTVLKAHSGGLEPHKIAQHLLGSATVLLRSTCRTSVEKYICSISDIILNLTYKFRKGYSKEWE